LSSALKKFHGFGVSPVEGLVDSRIFLGSFETKTMLCTQYIRHASNPEYTPEPDIVHEVI
jgi:phenylalanine-4-hydroxylase